MSDISISSTSPCLSLTYASRPTITHSSPLPLPLCPRSPACVSLSKDILRAHFQRYHTKAVPQASQTKPASHMSQGSQARPASAPPRRTSVTSASAADSTKQNG
jgi:hypothetical protein